MIATLILARGVQDWSEDRQFIFWVVLAILFALVLIVALIGHYFGKRDD